MRSIIMGLALAASALTLGATAQAASVTSAESIAVEKSAINVQYGRCVRWRPYCAARYPALGFRYRRCLGYHGCFGGR